MRKRPNVGRALLCTYTHKAQGPFQSRVSRMLRFVGSSLVCSARVQKSFLDIFKSASSSSFKSSSVSVPTIRTRYYSVMAPLRPEQALQRIEEAIKANKVAIFSKSSCPYCVQVKGLFSDLKTPYWTLELDVIDQNEAALLQEALKQRTGMSTVPNVFVNGQHVGGCDDTMKLHQQNKLLPLLGVHDSDVSHSYDYDLIVVGGGSGGLAASKAAAKLGKKVALLDFVKPSPQGTTWGIGGTCVNVGCIPKILMHKSAIVGQVLEDASSFGWNLPGPPTHNWADLVERVQNNIKSTNWVYRVQLREGNVEYLNEFAEFVDEHTVLTTNKKNKQQKRTAKDFLIAVGGRPRYPEIPGAREFGVTSDDLFSLPYNPGKTLLIGASYISLECAGFLAGLGIDTTVMVRSILLRGFDQQIANMIGEHMEKHNVRFQRHWVPVSVEKIEDGSPPRLLVRSKSTENDSVHEEEYNTVVFAIGRDPCTRDLKLENAGVATSPKTGKIISNPADQTNIPHIYAIGDAVENRPELTPPAILAGNLLANRLYGGSTVLTDYEKIPTTVFTPLEYGCVGLSEEDSIAKYGEENIEVYHTFFQPFEYSLPQRDPNTCYAKLVCNKADHERVLGFHYLGPNAGEITQGFAMGIKFNATKSDFDNLVGIHPTSAEIFTLLKITKSSGESPIKKGCCG